MLDTFSSAPVPQHERSPADAGPVGRIAFDMFMEDKTAGKFSQMLNENPFESFQKMECGTFYTFSSGYRN